jgi:hypothetical protein
VAADTQAQTVASGIRASGIARDDVMHTYVIRFAA